MMTINFTVKPKEIREDCFSFGNIESRYGANSLYFTKDGKPFIPISGEYHFSRDEAFSWRRELLKMKAGGLNFVATYIFWIHHEEREGEFNFKGNRDIASFLKICKEIGMPCVLRIGPWAHGECVYGGFPKFVAKMNRKRGDYPKYLEAVKRYWTKLYNEVRNFCDGETVIGIQLENEYTGTIEHIHTLRKLAEEIGFKTPFFNMTAWPTNTPDRTILPLFGGYPEAPWTWHRKRLQPTGRFAICEGRSEVEIGEDLIKTTVRKATFDDFPYAGCEVGVGNQVTQHRRPKIDENDGYGVALAKFASGMNWIGYYMYHGGRNPKGGLYQESKRTLYPNNYPIIDYDFQAPISKDGELRPWANRLRLMHYFISNWDEDLAAKGAFFADGNNNYSKWRFPYCSVRSDENLSGYLFVSNYERSIVNEDIADVRFVINNGNRSIELPKMNVKGKAMFFMPFNFNIGKNLIDYVTAQPIAKVGKTHYYMECSDIEPVISINGEVKKINGEIEVEGITLKILNKEQAYRFYLKDDGAIFTDGSLYVSDGQYLSEKFKPYDCKVKLTQIGRKKLPYNHYLYTHGSRKYYKLEWDCDRVSRFDDAVVELKFDGLALQVFDGDTLIDDYFNTDGRYRLFLKSVAGNKGSVIVRSAAPTSFGLGHVYNEIGLKAGDNNLKIESVNVKFTEIEK